MRLFPKWTRLAVWINDSADFRRLIESPLIDVTLGTKAALEVLEHQGFGKQVRGLRRCRFLEPSAARTAGDCRGVRVALVADRRGIITAHVSSAQPLNDLQRQVTTSCPADRGQRGTQREHRGADPAGRGLLGGLVVRIGSRLYDTSLKSRLQRLAMHAMRGAA